METTVGQRIKMLITALGIKQTDLAGHAMTSKQNISTIMSDVNQPGAPVLINILRAYPQIDANWLIMGIGDMFLPNVDGPGVKLTPSQIAMNQKLKEIEHLNKEIEHYKEVIKLKDELLEEVRSKLKK